MDTFLSKIILLLILFPLALGVFALGNIFRGLKIGMPAEQVNSLTGTVLYDGQRTGKGGTFILVRIDSCRDINGTIVSAEGVISLLLPGYVPLSLLRDDRVVVFGVKPLLPARGGMPPLFAGKRIQRMIQVSESTSFIRSVRVSLLRLMVKLDASDATWPGLFVAMSAGYQDNLEEMVKTGFTRTGCSHLLALSGFNLGILVSFFGIFLNPLVSRGRWRPFLFPLFIGYLMMTGFIPSLTRALIFLFLIELTRKIPLLKGIDPLLSLFFTLLVQAVWFPWDLQTLSCRISYQAMAGMLAFSSPITAFLRRFVPRFAAELLGATLSAQIAVLPYIQLIFGRTTALGLLAGPPLQVLVLLFFQGGMIQVLFCLIPGIYPDLWLGAILEQFYRFMKNYLHQAIVIAEKAPFPLEYSGWGGCFFLVGIAIIPLSGWIIATLSNRLITALPKPYGVSLPSGDSP